MSELTYTDKALADRIMDFLKRDHSGRGRAIPYRDVMAIFAIENDGQDNHGFRKLYENRVGSCSAGIFYIAHGDWKEALWWKGWLERTYHSAALAKEKYDALLKGRADLRVPGVPTTQGAFDFSQPTPMEGAGT